jgi:hypothetical protein
MTITEASVQLRALMGAPQLALPSVVKIKGDSGAKSPAGGRAVSLSRSAGSSRNGIRMCFPVEPLFLLISQCS